MSTFSQFSGGGGPAVGEIFLMPDTGLQGTDSITLKGKEYTRLQGIKKYSSTSYPDLFAMVGPGWEEFGPAINAGATALFGWGDGTNAIMMHTSGARYSTDAGLSWNAATWTSAITTPSLGGYNGMCSWVTDGATFATSTDNGVNWVNRTLTASSGLKDSCSNGSNLMIAVGNAGTNNIFSSTDGITWTTRSTNQANFCAYGNGTWVAVATSGLGYYSTDVITWNSSTMPSSSTYGAPTALKFNGTEFVMMLGQNNAGSNYYFYATSTDGITWTIGLTSCINANYVNRLQNQQVYTLNGQFVQVTGNGNTGIHITKSPDMINWDNHSIDSGTNTMISGQMPMINGDIMSFRSSSCYRIPYDSTSAVLKLVQAISAQPDYSDYWIRVK